MRFLDFVTNNDGKGSTTGFIQFLGFFVLSGVLIYAVFASNKNLTDLYAIFAFYCGGLVATKGAVTAYKSKIEKTNNQTKED